MAKVAFNTLGCKVNQYETESMMAQFEAKGYELTAFSEKADVYVVNTCTVTNMADKKSRQMLSKAKKNNPEALVVAVGCYVQAAGESLGDVANVDLLVGNTDKNNIVGVVEDYLDQSVVPSLVDLSKYKTYDDMWLTHESGHARVHIKIQDGCDQFCSYCIIPFARGRIRSRSSVSIIEEVTSLVAKGYQEVVLTGIHLASYGVQFDDYVLIDLLEELDQIKGLSRIRLGSLEPTLINQAFVKRLSKLSAVCDHFHLSMQAGDDEVLAAMNRNYNTQEYAQAVADLRRYYPHAAITTDLIVGFPGESDEQFANTLRFIEAIEFSDVHVFKYSPRDGTKAAKMAGQVDGNVKNRRSQRVIDLVESLRRAFELEHIGRQTEVLIEETITVEETIYSVGHTSNYLKVYIKGELQPMKSLIAVNLEEVFKDGLMASVAE